MTKIIKRERINQIIIFLKSLNIRSKRFSEITSNENISMIQDFNQALIHSSDDNEIKNKSRKGPKNAGVNTGMIITT